MPVRSYVYVDGFNLYYGAVRGTPYKWLDVRRLSELLLPGHSIEAVRYFTARVSARKDDPHKPTRQQIYLRALRTLPGLEIIYGSFLSHDVMMLLAEPNPDGPKFVKVTKTEEKGSDVNLATHLMHDAHLGRFRLGRSHHQRLRPTRANPDRSPGAEARGRHPQSSQPDS